jgi:hypothetical protein
MMRLLFGELKKVVAVAGQQNAVVVVRELENEFVSGILRQDFAQECDGVTKFFQ